MNDSSFASSETKVYRFNLAYRWYHFAAGTGAVVGAVLCRDFFLLAIVLALFGVFIFARPLVMAVTVDRLSVTFKGMFSENSIERSSITAVETKFPG